MGDGRTDNTAAFRSAMSALALASSSHADEDGPVQGEAGDASSGSSTGGMLVVPAGTWVTGPFNLTSHMTLYLEEGAVIKAIEVQGTSRIAPVLLL